MKAPTKLTDAIEDLSHGGGTQDFLPSEHVGHIPAYDHDEPHDKVRQSREHAILHTRTHASFACSSKNINLYAVSHE